LIFLSIISDYFQDDQSGSFQYGVRRDEWKLIWGSPTKFQANKKRQKAALARTLKQQIIPEDSENKTTETIGTWFYRPLSFGTLISLADFLFSFLAVPNILVH
jgi:hypothetical protein